MGNGPAQAGSALAHYRILRELGRRSQRSYAATRGDGATLVLHRFTRDANVDAELVSGEEMAVLLRDARCMAEHWHPNIAHVRHIDHDIDILDVATELVEGVTLEELLALARDPRAQANEVTVSHPILARIFLDVLAGLSALHSLRDGIRTPLGAFHGELCPANVVVGKDGVARLVSVLRPRPVRISARSEALGYASPETLATELDQDARVDIYGVGVMLWEALMNHRLYEEVSPSRIAQRQREEDIPCPDAALADVAMRALAFDAALRFRRAYDMATEIRALAGSIAQGRAVAQLVNELAAERIRARRMDLDAFARAPPTGSQWSRVAPPTRSGMHLRASAPTLPGPTEEAMPPIVRLALLPEGRLLALAAPEIAEPHAQRPSLAHPPPNAIAADLPGPRQSSPDSEDLEKLTDHGQSAHSPGSSPMLDTPDQRTAEEDDGDAVRVAREVTLSARSLAPRGPSDPNPNATAATAPAAGESASAAPLARTPTLVSTLEAGPFPPAETVLPKPPRVAQRRRLAPLVALATAILVLIFIAATILLRSSGTRPIWLPTRSPSPPVPLSHV